MLTYVCCSNFLFFSNKGLNISGLHHRFFKKMLRDLDLLHKTLHIIKMLEKRRPVARVEDEDTVDKELAELFRHGYTL